MYFYTEFKKLRTLTFSPLIAPVLLLINPCLFVCRFVLPSVLYAVNNNIYYAGLMLVPPPIWIILTSFRTVVTASLYKVRERVLCSSLLLYGSSSPHSVLLSPHHYYKVRERVLCSSLHQYGSSSPHSALLSPHHYTR
jgi:hypothetical protein